MSSSKLQEILALGPVELRRLSRLGAARKSLARFVKQAWAILEPSTPLIWNWHIDAICQHLEAVSAGKIQNLLINVPPGSMKSLTCSVFWPAWQWLHNPALRIIAASAAIGLSLRDSIKCRQLIESDWYRSLQPAFKLSADQNAKGYYSFDTTGFRMALSVGGAVTGQRADVLLVDDPLDAKAAFSKPKRDGALLWWSQAFRNRVNDNKTSRRVVIMQRLHEEDLSGHILAKESEEGWVHLRLPQEYESVTHCKTSLPFEDPRTEEGELLFPERFPPEVLVTEKRVLGSYGYAGQHQQRPSPAEGGIYKRAWFNRRWVRKGASTEIPGMEVQIIPDRFDQMAMIADCAFKDTDTSDRVAIGVWGKKGPNLFLLDLRWDQMGLTTTIATFNDLAQKWPMVRRKMIEDKANGTAVIEVLKKKLPGVMPIDSKETSGGKDARIHAASPDFEAGNVWIPTDAPWVADYIEECVTYPAGAHDDALDMSSYAVNYLSESSALARMAALGRLGEGKLKRR